MFQYNNGMPGVSGSRPPLPNYNQFVPSTNKQFVRSLEEALSLPANFNSQNVYFDINKDVMYDICTNGNGEKSWTVLNITLAQSSAAQTRPQSNVEDRLTRIENRLEELINGKHNAESPNSTNE